MITYDSDANVRFSATSLSKGAVPDLCKESGTRYDDLHVQSIRHTFCKNPDTLPISIVCGSLSTAITKSSRSCARSHQRTLQLQVKVTAYPLNLIEGNTSAESNDLLALEFALRTSTLQRL